MRTNQETTSLVYDTRSHLVANIGERPHNLQGNEVDDIIENATGELALLMLKPDYYPVHPVDNLPLQRIIEGMLTASGLDVRCTSERELSHIEVCELYRGVMPPDDIDDGKWGVSWKRQMLTYATCNPVFSYLLEGTNAFRKAHLIKNIIRNKYAHDPTTQVIKNIGHVPDPQDFDISLEILFKDGLIVDQYINTKARSND